ncbi:MAG TPA: hypothetical protein DCM87_03275 [Planctomycetes bacterium]|nr:hypothetical protein [Planctomycetota bacterium]
MAKTPEPASTREENLRENLLLTLDMFESGLSLVRERLRRESPGLSEEAVEERLVAWLADRPPDGPAG